MVPEEHESLRILLWRLRDVRTPERLLRLLDEMQQFLIDHFVREERQGGLFSFVVDACPRHAARVQRLRSDHKVILAELERLLTLGRAPFDRSWCWSLDVASFVDMVEDHESVEASIFVDAIQDELGVGY